MAERRTERASPIQDKPGNKHSADELFSAELEDKNRGLSVAVADKFFKEHIPILQELPKANIHRIRLITI